MKTVKINNNKISGKQGEIIIITINVISLLWQHAFPHIQSNLKIHNKMQLSLMEHHEN